MGLSYKMRLVILGVGICIAAGAGLVGKGLLVPESFGVYGHYRADAIEENVAIPIRHGTNDSCFSCHAHEARSHRAGLHKSISCEFCHGPYADHVAENKKTGSLPVRTGEQITTLCLRCHNTEIKARPEQVIKTVAMPGHLESQHVKITHTCNQCHYVHAPMKYIIRARNITGLTEKTL